MRSLKKWMVVDQAGSVKVMARKPRTVPWSSFVVPLTINIPDTPASPSVELNLPSMTEGQVIMHDLDVVAGA